MSRITQTDIAKSLGLSVSTVALVVGHSNSPLRDRLSKATVERILKKADELGYQPNRTAQIMQSGRSNLIVLLNMGGHSQLAGRRAFHIGEFVYKAGFDYQSVEAYWWPGDGSRIINQIIDLNPEGVIMTGTVQAEVDYVRLKRAKIPTVPLNIAAPFPGIQLDSASAMRELTLQCIAQGRKRIALLIRDTANYSLTERKTGFLQALEAAGWPPPTEYCVQGELPTASTEPKAVIFNITRPSPRFSPHQEGEMAAKWFLDYPDALLCTNDDTALGVLSVYQARGIEVPGQVAVSGFDNISYSALESISLTTVEQPIGAMSEAAVNTLVSMIRNKAVGKEQIFRPEIIWRKSLQKASASFPTPIAH